MNFFASSLFRWRCSDNNILMLLSTNAEGLSHKETAPQFVEKVQPSWAFSRLYDKMVLGDERCWNEG
ncbi:MAG: hypothetical protein KH138_12145, partial [Firmicutes bacterium]|nr:hypothetical protein [Bacillota bacterium]